MKETNNNLKDIIRLCAKGERRAQNQLFRLTYGKMFSVCIRYAGSHEDARDIVQEGYIKVFAKLSGFNGKGSFEGWMRRIMVNTAIDSIRRRKLETQSIDEDEYDRYGVDDTEESWDEILSRETIRVLEAIEKLSPRYRLVFNLYVVEEYSHQEIAEMLDISVGASKSNLFKAKKNLIKYLKEETSNE
ncbi:MAG TPA: RNA polymerase subunit sigma-70 [Flavobacteriales bacterium]|jgi:RNA polymerase sigma factor (sigma-70 family)|nr:RNA polymerase subunit sigma-70 [Flavobacteriales bacterium]